MSRPILVPLDGSEFAERALPLAAGLARSLRAPLALVRVHVPTSALESESGVPALAWWWEESRHAEQSYLERHAAALQSQTGMRTSTNLLYGSASRVLAELIDRSGTRLVVMTTHGRGGLGRMWLGSTADALLRESTAPILLIRPSDDERPARGGWNGFAHVVVALDGSKRGETALAEAVVVGGAGSRYTLLRVAEPVLMADVHPAGRAAIYLQDLEAHTAEAAEYLARVEQRIRALGLPVTSRVLTEVPVAEGIAQCAAGHGADLIAMSTRGLWGLKRLALGSVADEVIRSSRIPLLVIGPKHRAVSQPSEEKQVAGAAAPEPTARTEVWSDAG